MLSIAVTEQNKKIYVFISERKSWDSAQAYCRKHYTDLPVIENSIQNDEVIQVARAFVWIGLYRVPWTWSDKTQSSFRSWGRTAPNNNYRTEFCVAANSQYGWDDYSCNKEFPFICHQGDYYT